MDLIKTFWLIFFPFTVLIFISCTSDTTLFEKVPAAKSGIHFENRITETSEFNILSYEYIYNGTGVAAADFNQNGYIDLFFVGNMTQNKLYLNRGDFRFTDVTEESGTGGNDEKWYSGVAVVDINNNGLPDIYISATGRDDPELRRNELYVHQGVNENGIPVFKEMAAAYGLDDTSFSTQAYFFDFNNNGILDLYLLVAHSASPSSYTNVSAQRTGETGANRDRLFTGVFDEELGHPVYRDISEEAGINRDGYGLGVNILDLNGNGLPDIYVANDYITDDLFWINNGDGTFTDRARELFKHFSFSAMGTDAGDLNNNGLLDIFTLDMLPEVNVRRKMMANPNNYRNYLNNAFEGYHPQYTRNTLQMNLGPADSSGYPVFSEAALLAGVAETDWSWAALLADLDNDGFRDLLVTNGIPRDVTDKDFWDEYGRVRGVMPMSMALPKIPEVKISNYLFKNLGPAAAGETYVTFSNKTGEWGLDQQGYSTGALYADLDNNGSLDLVINNINQPASVYRNRLYDNNNRKIDPGNWLKIDLRGPEMNKMGLGATIDLYFDNGRHQTYQHTLYRGYLSSMDPRPNFGLGEVSVVDSLLINWPGGNGFSSADQKRIQRFENLEANQILTVAFSDAVSVSIQPGLKPEQFFRDVTAERGITYRHQKNRFNDFHQQPLLPYKVSEHGTGISVGDLSGNGLDDIFIGGSSGYAAVILYQQTDGTFTETRFEPEGESDSISFEDSSVLLFDANNNGLTDIYIASGGVTAEPGSPLYSDRIYRNNGDGTFTRLKEALPDLRISSSVVAAADFNLNGQTDLFVGGRVTPGRYPEPESSLILRNDSYGDVIHFTDVTDEVAPMFRNFGVVNDAVWSDFSGSGYPGVIIASEWQPLRFIENRHGMFEEVTGQAGVLEYKGWWFTVSGADLTGNGHMDFIAGNLGHNSLFRASREEPSSIWFGDLTGDGFFESIPFIYGKDSDGTRSKFPYHNREDVFRQMPEIGTELPTHRDFGEAVFSRILTNSRLGDAEHYEANYFSSSLFLNRGDGTFEVRPLPVSVQAAPVKSLIAKDITGDSIPDVLVSGNFFGADLQTGSYNALNGVLLKGLKDGEFKTVPLIESGFFVPGDARSAVMLNGSGGESLVAVLQNRGLLRMFEVRVSVNE